MKKFFRLIALLAIITAPLFTAIVQQDAAAIFLIAAILLVSFLIPSKIKGVFSAGIQKEIWENDIVSNLYKNNEFLQYAANADQYVLQGKVVHIPQAGADPNVVKNRTTLPATITQRTDTDVTYNLDEYTSDPILIPNADTVELSYDKRNSVTASAQAKLRQEVAENMLVNWAATNVIKTTGGATLSHLPGTTGNRKLIVLADLQAAMTKLNRDDVPMESRYAIFSANMYDQFINSLNETQYRDFSRAFDEKNGILGRLYGFNIMMRSSVLVYAAADTVKPVGAASAVDDDDAVLVWQMNSIERAMGSVKFFERVGDPQNYGDIYSFLLRMGGRIRRNDSKGVLAITQAASA